MTLGDLLEEAAWVADSSRAYIARYTYPEFGSADIAEQQTYLEKLALASQSCQPSSEVIELEPLDVS